MRAVQRRPMPPADLKAAREADREAARAARPGQSTRTTKTGAAKTTAEGETAKQEKVGATAAKPPTTTPTKPTKQG